MLKFQKLAVLVDYIIRGRGATNLLQSKVITLYQHKILKEDTVICRSDNLHNLRVCLFDGLWQCSSIIYRQMVHFTRQ